MDSDSKNATSRLYKLGRNVFCAVNCDVAFIDQLDVLLPHYAGPELGEGQTLKVKTGCSKNIEDILRLTLTRQRHLNCAWINGALLVSPKGQSVLIVGKGAGKTTISLALALGYGWKVASENYVVVDYQNNELVPYNAPMSFQSDALELLRSLNGLVPNPIVESMVMRSSLKWSPLAELATDCERELTFDLAVMLDRTEASAESSKIAVTQMSPSEYFRKLLPQSNLLKVETPERVVEALGTGNCLRITGGDIKERVHAIFEGLEANKESKQTFAANMVAQA
jgi:hypothetical protein